MLTSIKVENLRNANGSFAIVASEYNERYVGGMVKAAVAELKRVGVKQIEVVRVPGAFEIPIVAARLCSSSSRARKRQERFQAIICLGVILRGKTLHAELIGESVTRALMELQLEYHIPVIHEVLLLENQEQAHERCLTTKHNRGTEAAQTALKMAAVMKNLA